MDNWCPVNQGFMATAGQILHRHYSCGKKYRYPYYFELRLHNLKVIQKPWVLVSKQIGYRSLKWGTKHWFWSRGCKDIRSQSWRLKETSADQPGSSPCDCARGQPSWQIFFFNLPLWPLISLQLLDQNQCLVSHIKDLFHICLETKGQGFWTTFTLHHTALKSTPLYYINRPF